MRPLLATYLTVYFLTVTGAAFTIWSSGLLEHLHRGWTQAVFAGALLLGVLLAVVSRRSSQS